MKIKEITDYLDSVFHPEMQEDYDNSGFLLGDGGEECRGALVALDLTEAVLDEAKALGMNLIVTHHPVIFHGVKRITDERNGLLYRLLRSGTAVYAAHTNLDSLAWGVSGVLAGKLGLKECRILQQSSVDKINVDKFISSCPSGVPTTYQHIWCAVGSADNLSTDQVGLGMVGELEEPVPLKEFLLKVKTLTGIPCIRFAPCASLTAKVRRVALCGGSGADFIDAAKEAGADLYLTADLKYHDFQEATPTMALADIGHYESEQFAKEIIFHAISEKFSTFACRISDAQKSIVSYI